MATANIKNGVNVTQLTETIEVIKQEPDVAKFQFRANNQWQDGTYNRATVKDFFGAREEDTTREPMVFDIDEPPILLGGNRGANPVEYLLVGLSGCMTTTLVAYAAAKGIEIRGVESRYEGDLDLHGFLGLTDNPAGYKNIRVFFKIDADIPDDQKRELIELSKKHSPVYGSVSNPTPIEVGLDN